MRFYRETWADIDLDALDYNIRSLENHHHKALIAIIKANAYGHGDEMIAKKALASGAKILAVSSLDEALSLRYKKVKGPILVLGYIAPKDLHVAIEEKIIVTVTSFDWAKAILNQDLHGLIAHLKIDTGMNRMGLKTMEEINSVLSDFDQAGVTIEGLYTHFASSDDPKEIQTKEQYERFETLYHQINRPFKWIHCSNSDAAIHFDTPLCNAVRIGLALFGYSSFEFDLKPVMTLKTKLVNIKTIQKGEKVSYGATYTAPQQEIIATIPIGYADGWNRKHQGDVAYIGDVACEFIGRICMDQCMIRLDRHYPEGTEVELLGKKASIYPMAKHLETIPYEILTQLSDRIPKVYYEKGKVVTTINPRLIKKED
jgi:alanine racemase